jgi:cell wall-associated NlpC family hydrolase
MSTHVRLILAALGVLPVPLAGQGVAVGAARWLTSPKVSEYRVGFEGFSWGPLSYRPTLQYLRQAGTSRAAWAGAGADLIVRATPLARPYLIGGLALGLGRASDGGGLGAGLGAWGGLGAELLSFGPVGLQAEALYSWRSRMRVRSVTLGLRVGARIGRQLAGQQPSPVASGSLPQASAADEETIRLATAARVAEPAVGGVVGTALAVMGTPYQWGGTGPDGFDCSGLIQYAYAQHGLTLPRTSVEQARAGSEVGTRLEQLLPGDILTFAADKGGAVAHVGLYLGDGRFIHSANGGVQIGRLSADDAAGQWWWARWIGTRRVLLP